MLKRLRSGARITVGAVVTIAFGVLLKQLWLTIAEAAFWTLIVGLLVLTLLYRGELRLPQASHWILTKGAKHPMSAFLIIILIGGGLGAFLFGGSWLWMINEHKKNPPPLAPSPVVEKLSEQQTATKMPIKEPPPEIDKQTQAPITPPVAWRIEGSKGLTATNVEVIGGAIEQRNTEDTTFTNLTVDLRPWLQALQEVAGDPEQVGRWLARQRKRLISEWKGLPEEQRKHNMDALKKIENRIRKTAGNEAEMRKIIEELLGGGRQ